MTAMAEETFQRPVGELLRDWRQRRRMSQLDLANIVDVSTRHLSFVETSRAKPSREMVLRLAEHLDVPLRDGPPRCCAALIGAPRVVRRIHPSR